jgi:hypothetical protein
MAHQVLRDLEDASFQLFVCLSNPAVRLRPQVKVLTPQRRVKNDLRPRVTGSAITRP